MKNISWEEIEPLIERFCVWVDRPELQWFRKAWKSLDKAGLTGFNTNIDRQRVLIRGVALGIMYDEYCELEWDEYSDPSSCIHELFHDDIMSPLLLGAMAADFFEPDEFDDHTLFEEAILCMAAQVKIEVYDAIKKGFSDSALLYTGLKMSRCPDIDQEKLEEVSSSLFDASGFLINGRDEAFAFVTVSSMLGKDA